MCGHVGMAGELIAKHDKVLKNLLMMDAVRGEDSTGVAFIPRHGEVRVAKQVGDPFVLFNHNSYSKGIAQVNRVMLGHNRYATSGGISRHTAHPFEFDSLVGAHNGTLGSKYKLLDHMTFRVDSENLFHHIEQRGLQDALDQLGFQGNAWALVWWDKDNENLNFLRNKERTLYLVTSEDGKQIFWASEAWMLHGALSRNDVKYGEVSLLPEDTLLTIHVNNKGELGKPVLRRHAAPVPVIQAVQQANNQKNNQHTATKGEAKPKKENVVVSITKNQAGTAEANGSVNSYLSRKNVKYEILSAARDTDGAEYLTLFDPEHPYAEVRVYFRAQDTFLKECLGEEVIGSVSTYIPYAQMPSRGYFKVSPWTIQLVTQPGQEGRDAVDADMDNLFPDANGKMIPELAWKKKYGDCAYCSVPLDPAAYNRFTTAGECLCEGCSKSEEALQYVNLV